MIYIVDYTDELMNGYRPMQMEIEASNLETAYEIMNEQYPDICIDTIYAAEDAPDGQPDEAQEWHDFDPDC